METAAAGKGGGKGGTGQVHPECGGAGRAQTTGRWRRQHAAARAGLKRRADGPSGVECLAQAAEGGELGQRRGARNVSLVRKRSTILAGFDAWGEPSPQGSGSGITRGCEAAVTREGRGMAATAEKEHGIGDDDGRPSWTGNFYLSMDSADCKVFI
ncbi:hypothetical protein BRADI_2g23696v3 [Brachypodium distachyon]|uniref:Uncharacterized protein n=1 Tax=Brachypodium distachyon TaxID=15368 RepID=A0A2K2DA60_BRADI|nr:hypothetical protein BRADI_2g23696v3 [Brachypodium distachyon]